MAKMGKLTPEEEARNKILMRERDRERKRMKRLNPEYRRMEQERDRDRKKARRANEAFRQLEKLRDKIRKERKKGIISEEALQAEFANIPPVPVEPEVIITDALPGESVTSTENNNNNNSRQRAAIGSTATSHNISHSSSINSLPTTITTAIATAAAATSASTASAGIHQQAPVAHMPQLNKGLLYPPPNFAHHPLPIAGVTLMPQLCHPILHQNLGASLYPTNGIKQEYHAIKQEYNADSAAASSSSPLNAGAHGTAASNSGNTEDRDIAIIEPEIILHTSSDIIAAPHHFQNAHAHAHHLHQQQCSMFQHMAPQAHMSQMRAHATALPPPPPPPATHAHNQQQQHQQQQQQQHMQQHYSNNKGS